ncbi:MAG: DUF3108 domain-containing protein, partial [Micavibrio sp.]|nr:DUF3108 domain-containing protein [Micavibrio sp.]
KVWVENASNYLAYLLLSTVILLLCTPANAAGNSEKFIYEVYAGGIHAVEAELHINSDKKAKRYNIVLNAITAGFLKKFVPWTGTFESKGWIKKDDKFRPELHQSTTGWKEDIEISTYKYNKDGTFKSLHITDNHSENEIRKTTKELTDHTTDVLSATLQILNDYKENGKCEGEADVFDGKRRFKQSFKPTGTKNLDESRYSIAEGASAECVVEVTPIAGEWHKKPRGWMSIQEQGRDRGMMPTLWIGRVGGEDGPIAPLKIRVKTAYGTLFMHLAEYSDDKTILKSVKRQ